MFFAIVFSISNDISTEVDVEENTFLSLLNDIHSTFKVFANVDEDGCYYYYFVNRLKDVNYFGCSSELFADSVDSYF